MRKILLIKTSSLGDVVHNLPVVEDIRRALGEVAIDWAVEKSFAAIPVMHPAIRRVIPCELRQWGRSWLAPATRRAWRSFVAELRAEQYDCVIDTQGLLKSAIVARAARGRRVGMDWKSSREPLRPFYDQVFSIPWTLHAVERNRRLAALALGYEVAGGPRYGISAEKSVAPWMPSGHYAVFLHGTSHPRKLWPESRWVDLGTRLALSGYSFVLPWGNRQEHERAQRLAAVLPSAVTAPRLSIEDVASMIAGARFVVGVDTGLTHLAAALTVAVVGIYGATDPRATGIQAPGHAMNLGNVGRFPSCEEVVEALGSFGIVS
jgi:heptosyltransferase-1